MRTREVIKAELALAQNRCLDLNNELRVLNAKELGKYNVVFKIDTDDDFELDFGDSFTLYGNDVTKLLSELKLKLNSAELLWGCESKWESANEMGLQYLEDSFKEYEGSGYRDNELPHCHIGGNQVIDICFNRT